jgi:hypothetical protein
VALVATIVLWAIAITVVTMALYDGAPDDQWGELSLAVLGAPSRAQDLKPIPHPGSDSVMYSGFDLVLVQPSVSPIVAGRMRSPT